MTGSIGVVSSAVGYFGGINAVVARRVIASFASSTFGIVAASAVLRF